MRGATTALALTLAAFPAAMAVDTPADPMGALREGNRLYREGRLEEALAAYERGYEASSVHPVLAYNMATTSHELGHLAEAILWYRRAQAVNPGDPWLRENLILARDSLGLQPHPAPGVRGLVKRHASALFYLAALLAWGGLAVWIARPRRSARVTVALVAAAMFLYATTYLTASAAPRAAVVLEQCSGPQADLPPGSEVWITGESETAYEVRAGSATVECGRETVAAVVE